MLPYKPEMCRENHCEFTWSDGDLIKHLEIVHKLKPDDKCLYCGGSGYNDIGIMWDKELVPCVVCNGSGIFQQGKKSKVLTRYDLARKKQRRKSWLNIL